MVEAVLYVTKDGEEYASKTDCYSVATYAYYQLDRAVAPEALKTLCADLLRYGTAAQIYKGYRTDALADEYMTEAHRALLSDIDGVQFDQHNRELEDLAGASVTWIGKTLNLESKLVVRFVFTPSSYTGDPKELSMKLRYVNSSGEVVEAVLSDPKVYHAARNYYAFDFDGLLSTELRCVLTGAIYAGDTQVSVSTCYSAGSYGNGRTGTLLELSKALMAYADSASADFK